jgi:alkylated DNA nucleotide flippase Atl1
VSGGFIVDNEKDSSLVGQAKYLTFANFLANTSVVSAGVRLFLNLIGKAEWRVEPADGSAEALKVAELVDKSLHGMDTPWHRVVRRAAMFKFYGFSLQEWVMKRDKEGFITFRDIAPRAQITIEQWDVDNKGHVKGVIQRDPQNGHGIYIPRPKLVYLVDDSLNDSPEGLGLFRHISNACLTLARYQQLESFGYESDLRGIPIARMPLSAMEQMVKEGNLTSAQAASLRAPMEQFIRAHAKNPSLGMLLDSSTYRAEGEAKTPTGMKLWDVELLSGDGGPHKEVAEAIERLNREIARILGVDHLLLGSGDRGSFALSADKSQTFGMVVDSTLRELRESFEKDLLIPLFKLNGLDMDLMPTLRTEAIAYRDIRSVTQALVDLQKAGVPLSPKDPAVNEIRSQIGIPGMSEELAEELADQAAEAAKPATSPLEGETEEPTDEEDPKAEEPKDEE